MDKVTEVFIEHLDFTTDKALYEVVYDAFHESIVAGLIPAGSRINEKQISQKSNISRTPIRKALKRLEEEKLVQYGIDERGGATVMGITPRDVKEIFLIRRSFETIAAIEASKIMTEDDFKKLEAIVQEGETLYANGQFDQMRGNFRAFNQYYFERSDMIRLQQIAEDLTTYLQFFNEVTSNTPERIRVALDEHHEIIKLMRQQNVEQLELVIKAHLEGARDNILRKMAEHDGN
jgi:DNA-binding GntR family transcriptional regulator